MDRILGLVKSILWCTGRAGLIDQAPKRRGRAVSLGFEPEPMPREQGHLAPDGSQFRSSTTSRGVRCVACLECVVRRAATPPRDLLGRPVEIDVDLSTFQVVEDQDPLGAARFGKFADDFRNAPEMVRYDQGFSAKRAVAGLGHRPACATLFLPRSKWKSANEKAAFREVENVINVMFRYLSHFIDQRMESEYGS